MDAKGCDIKGVTAFVAGIIMGTGSTITIKVRSVKLIASHPQERYYWTKDLGGRGGAYRASSLSESVMGW